MILPPSARRSVDELVWFWNESDGDMGERSSFGPMVARLQAGGPTGGAPIMEIPDHQLDAATRRRLIAEALATIGPGPHVVLQRCLGFGNYRPELGAARAAALTTTARRAKATSRSSRPMDQWLGRLYQRERHECGEHPSADRMLVALIRRESEELLLEALKAFVGARRGQSVRRKRRRE